MSSAPILAAQVVVGDPIAVADAVAAKVAQYLPSAELLRTAREGFVRLGFIVGPTVGNGFSLSGAIDAFDKTFSVRLEVSATGVVQDLTGAPVTELSTATLAPEMRRAVRQVLFSAPPAFGPGSWP
jgi:hypothetical protein